MVSRICLRSFVGRSEGRVGGVRDVLVAVQREAVVTDPVDNKEEVSRFSGIFFAAIVPLDEARGNQLIGTLLCVEVIEVFILLHLCFRRK